MSKKLQLKLGAMSPTIKKQLTEQDFLFDKNAISHFQKDADAITRLRVRGYIPDSQLHKMSQKLVNNISDHIEDINKKILSQNGK